MNKELIKDILDVSKHLLEIAQKHEVGRLAEQNAYLWEALLDELDVPKNEVTDREPYYEVFVEYELGGITDIDSVINKIITIKKGG